MVVADGYYDIADFPKAAEAYREARRLYEGSDSALYMDATLGLALCLDQMGEHGEAESLHNLVIESSRASDSQKNAARRNRVYADGMRNFGAAEFATAHACFAKALELHAVDDEFRSDILMWMGACHSQLGQFAAAGETYTELAAIRMANESVKAKASQRQVYAEGQLHFAAGRYHEARGKFEEVLSQRGSVNEFRSGAMLMLAHCCFHLSDYRQAGRRYRQILETGNATAEQQREAREWRRALPSLLRRCLRLFSV